MLTCWIWINCATSEWSPRVLYANHCHNAWSGSSQHCPKPRRDPRDDPQFHRLYPGQFRVDYGFGPVASLVFGAGGLGHEAGGLRPPLASPAPTSLACPHQPRLPPSASLAPMLRRWARHWYSALGSGCDTRLRRVWSFLCI